MSTMFGTGQLPKFDNDQFELKLDDANDRKFLIPTAEVILTNIVKDKIFDVEKLTYENGCLNSLFQKRSWKLR